MKYVPNTRKHLLLSKKEAKLFYYGSEMHVRKMRQTKLAQYTAYDSRAKAYGSQVLHEKIDNFSNF